MQVKLYQRLATGHVIGPSAQHGHVTGWAQQHQILHVPLMRGDLNGLDSSAHTCVNFTLMWILIHSDTCCHLLDSTRGDALMGTVKLDS